MQTDFEEVWDPRTMLGRCQYTLSTFVEKKKPGLRDCFFPHENFGEYVSRGARMVVELQLRGCPLELAHEFAVLVLYDLVILVDDSHSLLEEFDGNQTSTLRTVLRAVSEIYELAREEGILSVRYLNSRQGQKNVTTEKVDKIVANIRYHGLSTVGTQLQQKVLEPFVQRKTMTRPLLAMVITDGNIEGERRGTLESNILNCLARLQTDPEKTEHAVAFMFARIGENRDGEAFLATLDDHQQIGRWIDNIPVDCHLEDIAGSGPSHWLVLRRLLLGAVLPEIDHQDDDQPRFEDDEDDDEGGNKMSPYGEGNHCDDVEDDDSRSLSTRREEEDLPHVLPTKHHTSSIKEEDKYRHPPLRSASPAHTAPSDVSPSHGTAADHHACDATGPSTGPPEVENNPPQGLATHHPNAPPREINEISRSPKDCCLLPPRDLPDARIRHLDIRLAPRLDNFHVAWLEREKNRWVEEEGITEQHRDNLMTSVGFLFSVPGMESRECTSSKRDIQDVYLVPIGADFPSLVVECGGLPDRQEMIADMRDWFRKGHGKVVKVILMIWIMLPEAIMGGRIEAYDFDHVQDREILVREWVFLPENDRSRSQSLQMTLGDLYGNRAKELSEAERGIIVSIFKHDFCDEAARAIGSSGLHIPDCNDALWQFERGGRSSIETTGDEGRGGGGHVNSHNITGSHNTSYDYSRNQLSNDYSSSSNSTTTNYMIRIMKAGASRLAPKIGVSFPRSGARNIARSRDANRQDAIRNPSTDLVPPQDVSSLAANANRRMSVDTLEAEDSPAVAPPERDRETLGSVNDLPPHIHEIASQAAVNSNFLAALMNWFWWAKEALWNCWRLE